MNRKGFTLIELLVVVAIIAILVALALVQYNTAKIRSLVAVAETDLRAYAMALAQYYLDNEAFPDDVRLRALKGERDPPWDPAKLLYPLTSPIPYLSVLPNKDPFVAKGGFDEKPGVTGRRRHFYYIYFNEGGPPRNPGVTNKEGWAEIYPYKDPRDNNKLGPKFRFKWKMYSNGPDNLDIDYRTGKYSGGEPVYDPTNGLRSWGDITRWGPE